MTQKLEKYISDLLYDYDCVIVPQLGGFVTNYRSARFDEKASIAYPPSKEVRFNKNLTKNDGLLSQAIAHFEEISFREADEFIKEAVEAYFSKMNGGDQVRLNKIGILYIDEHKNLRFEPDREINYLKSSLGFEPFPLPVKTSKISEPVPLQPSKPVEEETVYPLSKSSHSRSIYWVAAATLLPFIGMSIYLGLTTQFKSPSELTLAELFPVSSTKGSVSRYVSREAVALEDDFSDDKTSFPEDVSVFPFSFEKNAVDSTGVWVDLRVVEELAATQKFAEPLKYHIIGGCFSEKENAESFVSRLNAKNYEASILDLHRGLFRVKIESFSDYQTALSSLESMRADGSFPNAWLLKKPISSDAR